MGIEKMLRMYLLQCCFNLSDEGIEDAVYDSYSLLWFMKINFVDERAPDATTLLKFRHLLEKHGIAKVFFHAFTSTLEKCGYIMRGGTIVDATLIHAPSSTKNEKKQRDPEMCRTKKGKQYYFGMKSHIGVDAGRGYAHSLETTAANVRGITITSRLIREDDAVVYGDALLVSYPAEKHAVYAFPYVAEECSADLFAVKVAEEKNKSEYAEGVDQALYKRFHRIFRDPAKRITYFRMI
jgi:IS5 family transposase